MNLREGWRADCPACVASKFACDEHSRIDSKLSGEDLSEERLDLERSSESDGLATYPPCMAPDGGHCCNEYRVLKEVARLQFIELCMEIGLREAANLRAETFERQYRQACHDHAGVMDEVHRLRAALMECVEQNEACFLNHYGENPEGGALPEYIRRARALVPHVPPFTADVHPCN